MDPKELKLPTFSELLTGLRSQELSPALSNRTNV